MITRSGLRWGEHLLFRRFKGRMRSRVDSMFIMTARLVMDGPVGSAMRAANARRQCISAVEVIEPEAQAKGDRRMLARQGDHIAHAARASAQVAVQRAASVRSEIIHEGKAGGTHGGDQV